MPKKKSAWETAILKVLEKHKGIATLKNFYEEVPSQIQKARTTDAKHDIRGFLRRLKNVKKEIKQIGLSTYALLNVQVKNELYEEIKSENFEKEFFGLSKEKIHGYVEGMLIEIGNLKNYETYTPDKQVIFNGQKLSDIVGFNEIPSFTYSEIIGVVKQIDVIWFKDKFPHFTFDVENSTDYTKAFVRANELRYFKTKFFMVGYDYKENVFKNRNNFSSFNQIKDETKFISIKSIFRDYKRLVLENKNKTNSLINL